MLSGTFLTNDPIISDVIYAYVSSFFFIFIMIEPNCLNNLLDTKKVAFKQ